MHRMDFYPFFLNICVFNKKKQIEAKLCQKKKTSAHLGAT